MPSNSKPLALIKLLCVTVPMLLNVRLPVVVMPTLDVTVPTVPMAKPLLSKNDTVPVLPAKVVMALAVSVKV